MIYHLPQSFLLHIMDGSGKIVAQIDLEPAGGEYPTWLWQSGLPVVFGQEVKLPANLPPGHYSLELGIYSGPTQIRLDTWYYEPYINRIWENRLYLENVIKIEG